MNYVSNLPITRAFTVIISSDSLGHVKFSDVQVRILYRSIDVLPLLPIPPTRQCCLRPRIFVSNVNGEKKKKIWNYFRTYGSDRNHKKNCAWIPQFSPRSNTGDFCLINDAFMTEISLKFSNAFDNNKIKPRYPYTRRAILKTWAYAFASRA